MSSLLYEQALCVAETFDVNLPKNSAVLYSISYLPTTKNRDDAFDYVKKNKKAHMIEDTECGKKLVELGIGYQETGLSQEQVMHIWGVASRRFITSICGDVVAFVDGADERSVFRVIELPLLLKNDNVNVINGIDKYTFANKFIK